MLATVLYLVEGVVLGLPFFSSSGHGWKALLGPTGGYLEGFILAAWVVVRRNVCSAWCALIITRIITRAIWWRTTGGIGA